MSYDCTSLLTSRVVSALCTMVYSAAAYPSVGLRFPNFASQSLKGTSSAVVSSAFTASDVIASPQSVNAASTCRTMKVRPQVDAVTCSV